MAVNRLRRTLDFLAKMGLTVRDDPPKVIDIAARKWSETVDGFALSIEQAEQALSVVLRNLSASAQTLVVPGWLHFYKIEIDAPLTPFGRELLKPGRQTERITVTLAPGEPIETQVPLHSLFVLSANAEHRVTVSCALPTGNTLISNTIAISA